MILSLQEKTKSELALQKLQKKAPSQYNKMIESSVKLEGGIFTATGVVAEVSKNQVVIVTAAHNVDTYCRGAHTDHLPLAGMIREFVRNVSITMVSGGESVTATAVRAIPSTTSTKTDTEISGHDVIRLVVENAPFRYLVHRMVARVDSTFQVTRALQPLFQAPDLWHNKNTGEVTLGSRVSWANVMAVQFGFGSKGINQDPPAGTHTQVRVLDGAAFTYRAVTQQGETHFDHILYMPASADNTTWTGDSGGPLFVVDLTGKATPVLLGVALGSNFSQDNMADDPVRDNSISLYQPANYDVEKAKAKHWNGSVLDGTRFSADVAIS